MAVSRSGRSSMFCGKPAGRAPRSAAGWDGIGLPFQRKVVAVREPGLIDYRALQDARLQKLGKLGHRRVANADRHRGRGPRSPGRLPRFSSTFVIFAPALSTVIT